MPLQEGLSVELAEWELFREPDDELPPETITLEVRRTRAVEAQFVAGARPGVVVRFAEPVWWDVVARCALARARGDDVRVSELVLRYVRGWDGTVSPSLERGDESPAARRAAAVRWAALADAAEGRSGASVLFAAARRLGDAAALLVESGEDAMEAGVDSVVALVGRALAGGRLRAATRIDLAGRGLNAADVEATVDAAVAAQLSECLRLLQQAFGGDRAQAVDWLILATPAALGGRTPAAALADGDVAGLRRALLAREEPAEDDGAA